MLYLSRTFDGKDFIQIESTYETKYFDTKENYLRLLENMGKTTKKHHYRIMKHPN